MKPLRLYLKNSIGIKRGIGKDELDYDFTALTPGVIGVFGETGSGKTTFIEMMNPAMNLPAPNVFNNATRFLWSPLIYLLDEAAIAAEVTIFDTP